MTTTAAQHAIGDHVRVRRAFPPGHFRTPAYVRGRTGVIVTIIGTFPDPEELAYGRDGLPGRTLYRVRFNQTDLWTDYTGSRADTLDIDLYDHWLDAA